MKTEVIIKITQNLFLFLFPFSSIAPSTIRTNIKLLGRLVNLKKLYMSSYLFLLFLLGTKHLHNPTSNDHFTPKKTNAKEKRKRRNNNKFTMVYQELYSKGVYIIIAEMNFSNCKYLPHFLYGSATYGTSTCLLCYPVE